MAPSIQCDVVSAEKSIFSGPLEMIVVTAALGDMGIAPGHAPLLTQLHPGPIRLIHKGGKQEIFYVSGGMMEVQPRLVTLLADTAIRAEDINEAAAEKAREQALSDLKEQKERIDYTAAISHLTEAAAQIRALQQIRKKMGH